jgi:4-hydroxybenzoate polyprenyltransferase
MATVSTPPAPSAAPIERLRTYASFVRFEHTLFSLPLILAGVFSARGPALPALRWVEIAIAAVGARTAAMALNRLIDRRLDALNPRTKARELPSGRMRLAEGWGLLAASTVVYVAACASLGPWFLRVAIVPLVVFTVYPYLKRWTPFCHVGVGLALALAPLAGYAAAHPDLASPTAAWWLAGFALCWVSGFDIIYATLDEDFDRFHRVRSMVVWLGRESALRVAAVLHLVAFLCLACAAGALLLLPPLLPDWALPVVIAALTVTGVLLYLEQRWADDVHLAFFKVNVVVGFAVLATVLLARAAGGFR